MTFVAKLTIAIIALMQIPLIGEVFAQENDLLPEDTAEVILEVDSDDWFTSDKISGNIQVGDFVVGPGRSEINAKPGETIVIEISVTNRISEDRIFMLEVEDVVGGSDGKSLTTISSEAAPGPYSIREYISFPNDTFDLDLGERAQIPVTITVPPNAEPGGFYGSVLVSTVRKGGDADSLAPRSPIIARIGSLIFLTIEGEVEKGGETIEINTINKTGKWYETGPIELGVLYENTGSVHLNPYGEISIKNMIGEEVGFVTLEPWFVLPKSLRLREVVWDREFLFGRYTVEAQVNRGYEDIVDVVETSFWVLPWRMVGGVFLVLFIIIFSVRAFFRTFEFKKKEK